MRPIFLALVFLTACSGEEVTSSEPLELEARLSVIESQVFDGSCGFSACHDASSPASGLDLSVGVAHDQLVNRAATMAPAAMLVVPGQPDSSFLVRKLRGPLGENEGLSMPYANPPLPEEEISVIEEWIARGAAND